MLPETVLTEIANELCIKNQTEAHQYKDALADKLFISLLNDGSLSEDAKTDLEQMYLLWQLLGRVVRYVA